MQANYDFIPTELILFFCFCCLSFCWCDGRFSCCSCRSIFSVAIMFSITTAWRSQKSCIRLSASSMTFVGTVKQARKKFGKLKHSPGRTSTDSSFISLLVKSTPPLMFGNNFGLNLTIRYIEPWGIYGCKPLTISKRR